MQICKHYERIPPIELINTPITSHFFFMVKTFTFSLSKFQLYYTVLLTIVTMYYLSSSDLIHLIAENLDPFTNLSLFL